MRRSGGLSNARSSQFHSDEKKEQVHEIQMADAAKIVAKMEGWGSSVAVYVELQEITGSELKALLLAIVKNPWLDLEYFGPDIPKHIATRFVTREPVGETKPEKRGE